MTLVIAWTQGVAGTRVSRPDGGRAAESRHNGVTMHGMRPMAVAGTWYPGRADALAKAVDGYLERVGQEQPAPTRSPRAIISPHAGLMYSGPVAAHAYAAIAGRPFSSAVLVGPSHFVGFE